MRKKPIRLSVQVKRENDFKKIGKSDMRVLESLKEGLKTAPHVDGENLGYHNRIVDLD